MKRYLKVWFRLAHISFAEQLATRFSSGLFLLGKTFRFVFFLVFLFSLVNRTGGLTGYTKDQVVIFFLVFNLIDIITQLFFRGVYFFRQKVVSGELDFYLAKPMHPLFRIMAGHTDFLDLITLVALGGYFSWFLSVSSVVLNLAALVFFGAMLVLGLVIALSIHIVVVAIGVLTTEVDHTIMVYRDLSQMARIPVDVYAEPVRVFLTYLVPIALMITAPAKVLIGVFSWRTAAAAGVGAVLALGLSRMLWRYALSQYSSASS